MRWLRCLALACVLLGCFFVSAAEKIPPKPERYFTDEAQVVSPAVGEQINQKLADFERQTSNQILVAIYPKMESDSSIEDYTVRVAQSWHAGQKGKDNGAVLFVFIQDRKMFIQVGYGLEGALPDARCKQIVEDEIKPHFKNGDYDGGIIAGVNAMLAATRGEYKGSGTTVAQQQQGNRGHGGGGWIPVLVLFIIILIAFSRTRRRSRYWGTGWGGGWGGWMIGGGGFSGGGGYSGGDSGSFSSGGGNFGGGGAGGSW